MIRLFKANVHDYAPIVATQIANSAVGPGPMTARFEADLARVLGRRHVICTTSGTTALMLAMMALRCPSKTNFWFPAYGMLAGANAARLLEHRIHLWDVNDRGLLDFGPRRDELNWRGLLLFIDHNGQSPNPELNIAIEDAATALGIPGACSHGKLATLSFAPQKIITTGQGGAVVTDDDGLAQRVRQLIDHGGDWRETRVHERIGGNFKFNDVLASLGVAQLERLPQLIDVRMAIRQKYCQRLPAIDAADGWMVMFPSRDAAGLVAHLKAYDVEAAQLYPPVNWSVPYHVEGETFPGAEAFHKRMVYLPSHSGLSPADVNTICSLVEDFE